MARFFGPGEPPKQILDSWSILNQKSMNEEEALAIHFHAQELQGRGLHAQALPELEKAALYFIAAEGPQSPDLANVLADCSESLQALCRFEEAEEKAREAKDILDAVQSLLDSHTRGTLVARAYSVWGRSLRELGRYDDASAAIQNAIRECEQHFGSSHEEVAWLLNEYGIVCKYSGRFDEGESAYRRALGILTRRYGEDAVETAAVYHNLGGLAHARGDFAAGEPLGRKAYEIRRLALGEDDPATVADAVAWGGLLDCLERYEQSVPIYRRALAFYESRLGPDHFEVAATLNNLGMARAAQGEMEEAQALLARALSIKLRLFSDDHPEVRLTRSNLQSLGSSAG